MLTRSRYRPSTKFLFFDQDLFQAGEMYFPPADPGISANPLGDPDVDLLLKIVAILREARRQKGYTVRELARKVRIAHSFLSYAERGLSQPGLVVLLRWCRALDLDFKAVFEEAGSRRNSGN